MIRIILILFLFLSNCSTIKKGLGLEKDVPDEFLIKKNNPITKPPFYDLLPPDSKNTSKEASIKNDSTKELRKILDENISKNKTTTSSPTNKKDIDGLTNLENEILKKLDN